MTAYYVRSGASGSANGTSWANAYTTLATALSGKAAGDVFYISEDHAESGTSAVSIAFPGTNANPSMVYCVDHAGSVPPVSADLRTTAGITVTASNSITLTGSFSIYGLQLTTASNVNISTVDGLCRLESCKLATSSSGQIVLGASNNKNKIRLISCDLTFGSTAASIRFGGLIEMIGGTIAATGTAPTSLIAVAGSSSTFLALFDGVDISAFGSGKTLLANTSPASGGRLLIQNSKLGASVTPAATPAGVGAPMLDLVNCDSGATNYRNERYRYEGTLTTETTIVRTGGATDGTTPISHKIVTTANSKWPQPFESFPLAIWNDTVGSSVTATIYGIWGGGSVPNNDDIWIDVEYLGDSASPKSSVVTSGKADGLASGSAVTSDASSWGGSTTAFKMSVTFTPQQKGLVYVTVKAAVASSTLYIDPKVELT